MLETSSEGGCQAWCFGVVPGEWDQAPLSCAHRDVHERVSGTAWQAHKSTSQPDLGLKRCICRLEMLLLSWVPVRQAV